jgi:hypothetical protein
LPTYVLPTDRHQENDAIRSSLAYCLKAYSPGCVEGKFSEVRALTSNSYVNFPS